MFSWFLILLFIQLHHAGKVYWAAFCFLVIINEIIQLRDSLVQLFYLDSALQIFGQVVVPVLQLISQTFRFAFGVRHQALRFAETVGARLRWLLALD